MFSFTTPNTKCNIKVGYISSERGFVDGVGVYEANKYAKLNPGTQFIFRNRDFVKYLNINEVNALVPSDVLPKNRSGSESCSGIVGLNLEGDISKSVDDFLGADIAYTGGSTQLENVKPESPKKRVNFYGGGGVGVQAAPIIGIDGSILAVQVIHGGYGYKYPPIVDITDDTGKGGGVVARSIIKTRSSDEAVFVEEFDREEDYEEYVLDKCVPELESIGYGQRWGPDGKNLGKWDPLTYFNKTGDPIKYEIQRYQQYLLDLQKGAIIENNRIKGWWTTRQKTPLRVVSGDKVTREVYNVFGWWWGANAGVNPRGEIDNLYIKLFGRRGEPKGIEYWTNLRSKGQSLAQIEAGMKTMPEWQQVCEGECKPNMPECTYLFGSYWEYDKESFINKYGISPQQSSNVPATDHAGKTFTLEWEEEFPFDGEYIFNVQADNTAHLYIDNEPVGEKIVIGSGGAKGNVLSPPQKIKKFMSAGMRKITLDLRNGQKTEMKKIRKEEVATSNDVTFNFATASLFANGIEIPDLDIDVSKEYGEGKDIKESHTRKVEYGRVYPVKVRSNNQKPLLSGRSGVYPLTYEFQDRIEDIRSDGGNSIGWDDNYNDDGPSNPGPPPDSGGFTTLGDLKINKIDGVDVNVLTGGYTHRASVRFSQDMNLIGRVQNPAIIYNGKVPVTITMTYSWRDSSRAFPTRKQSVRLNDVIWEQTDDRHSSVTKTVTLYPTGTNTNSRLKLRTKGERVLQMEDWTDESWDDLISSVSAGRFYGISGSTCNYILDAPTVNPNSTLKGERAHVFNTLDWIKKANRKLWKLNASHKGWKDADFVNRYGVLPFDPTAVAKVEKKRKKSITVEPTGVPPSVKFEVGDDGKTYLKVIGNGRVKVGLEMDVDDEVGNRFGAAVKEVKIQADDGEIILKRSGKRFEKLSGTGIFSSGKKYLIKSLGGSKTSGSKIGVDKTVLQFDDAVQYGFDGRGYANVKVKSVTPVSSTKQVDESYFGYPDYPNSSTDDYAGFHEIIWNNVIFPEDGNYFISMMVDDNVVLTFSRPNQKPIVIDKKGFTIRGDHRTGTGKSTEIKYFKEGSYTLKAVLEQIPGAPLAHGNPMVLALDIKAAFISDEVEVISVESWNQNPFGVAMTIDAPLAPPPKEEPQQQQEGRCPNNPIWTTRYSADNIWYPVNVNNWSKFMNRYAISPLPPLGLKGTDGAGSVFRNTWKVQLPYKGYYGVKGTADNFGRLFIDGVEVLGPDTESNFDSYDSLKPKTRKIFLEEKTIEVAVEVENEEQFIWNTIDQKVFSTADWSSMQNNASTPTEYVDVTFKVSSASLYANNIEMRGVFSIGKAYGGPNFNETYNRNLEVGKVYDVIFTSNNTAQRSTNIPVVYKNLNPRNNPINVNNNGKRIDLIDRSGRDTNAIITIDKTDGGSVIFTDDGKGLKVTGGTAAKRVKTTITLRWSDNPRTGGVSLDSFSVADKTWTRTNVQDGSVTQDVYIYPDNAQSNQNNNANIRLRNKGKGVVQMEDWTDNDWVDIMASATDGEFYDMVGNTCKYRITSIDKTTPEVQYVKDGVTYKGPALYNYQFKGYGKFLNKNGVSPDYPKYLGGDIVNYEWNNVDFPEDGEYDFHFAHDAHGSVYLDGKEIIRGDFDNVLGVSAQDSANWNPGIKRKIKVNKGKHTIIVAPPGQKTFGVSRSESERYGWSDGLFKKISDDYYRGQQAFHNNPSAMALGITRKIQVAKVDPRTGKAQGKPWTVNPIGISAMLIPPPGPKKIDGVGIVTSVIITDPGNGFDPPLPPDGDGDPSGPPVILELDEVISEDRGMNYAPDDKVCIVNTETGEEICYIPPKGPFGEILPFDPRTTPPVTPPPPGTPPTTPPPGTPPPTTTPTPPPPTPPPPSSTLISPPTGFREYPQVIARTATGIGYKGIPLLKPVLDPIGVDPDRLIQVTDLPGLKQTGYYNGKPYYGAIFYENGISYAGYYDTPGQKVQIYATLQESIDATVTTPPSAIQRQGTDINSNNPRLNIPGTPDNLT